MTNERNDDEILGRALARAIETQDVRETPYEGSRIAERPARRGFPLWQLSAVAAALVLALAFGSWFTRPVEQGPVAASPTPSARPSVGGTVSPTPAGSPATVPTRVFFVRDLLPPVSANVPSGSANVQQGHVDSVIRRIGAAHNAGATLVPQGATNPLALVGLTSAGASVTATISGDTARVEFELPNGWGVRGAAQVQALVQQLVYVITEEPGIRRAHIVEKGKTSAVIDGLIVDKPLSREDVTDYAAAGSTKTVQGFGDASAAAARKLTARASVDTAGTALARLVIETDLQTTSPAVSYPDFKVEVVQNDETSKPLGGKWRMVVTVNGTDAATGTQIVVDKSPLRTIVISRDGANTVYEIGLDDLRPWRTAIAPKPFRIIVDVGGDPRTIAGNNAVYVPAYGATVGRTFELSGIAQNFEANVVIRVRDEREKEILLTHTTATNCCEPGGVFDATVQVPAGVTGRIYLEVFEGSAKDGSELKLIRIPLTVR